MAIAVVNKKQTGSAAATSLGITLATKGNILVAFISQTGTESAPTLAGGGWAISPTSASASSPNNRLFVAIKEAVGGESIIEATPAAGGAIQGISYAELSGATAEIDTVVASNNRAKTISATTEPVSTSVAGDAILTGLCRASGGSFGGEEAWTGEGPLENVETAASRCFSGVKVFASPLTGATFTAHWTTEVASGMLTVAIKPTSETPTTTAETMLL